MNETPKAAAKLSTRGQFSARSYATWEERAIHAQRVAARWLYRVGRAIAFRARYGPHKAFNAIVSRTMRDLILPIRNALLGQKPLTVRAGGQSFLLGPEGNVAMDIWARGRFERHELEFILGVLEPGMTFVDVGANVGLFSIPAAKKLQHGPVYAFEPTARTFDLLLKNSRLNNVANLHAVQSAVGDYVGEAVLQINIQEKDGLNTIGKPTHEYSEVVGTESVQITTLDNFIRQHDISGVDVMKVDVEGAELLVFRGAADLLARPDAPLILYEGGFLSKGFGYHPVETMWLLERHGYSCFVINSNTGQISIPPAKRAYDAMVIAVKSTHPLYPTVRGAAS